MIPLDLPDVQSREITAEEGQSSFPFDFKIRDPQKEKVAQYMIYMLELYKTASYHRQPEENGECAFGQGVDAQLAHFLTCQKTKCQYDCYNIKTFFEHWINCKDYCLICEPMIALITYELMNGFGDRIRQPVDEDFYDCLIEVTPIKAKDGISNFFTPCGCEFCKIHCDCFRLNSRK